MATAAKYRLLVVWHPFERLGLPITEVTDGDGVIAAKIPQKLRNTLAVNEREAVAYVKIVKDALVTAMVGVAIPSQGSRGWAVRIVGRRIRGR